MEAQEESVNSQTDHKGLQTEDWRGTGKRAAREKRGPEERTPHAQHGCWGRGGRRTFKAMAENSPGPWKMVACTFRKLAGSKQHAREQTPKPRGNAHVEDEISKAARRIRTDRMSSARLEDSRSTKIHCISINFQLTTQNRN